MARKPVPIDLKQLEKLASMHCTDEEIAAWFGIRRETFVRRKKGEILETLEVGRAKGRVSLRRAQFDAAIKGDRTMLIWLGKQLLGQRDIVTQEHEHSGEVTVNDNTTRELLLSRIASLSARIGAASSDQRPN
jgi:hypothetical protein